MYNIPINTLTVLHSLKDSAGHGIDPQLAEQLDGASLAVDTCLRQLWVFAGTETIDIAHDPAIDRFHGKTAYNFLLQTITGLHSSVPGETNVQGQFRCAWKRWQQTTSAPTSGHLNTLLKYVLADAREIRSAYLQNIGGNSYGSLARKLLDLPADAKVLFVGSGKFAASMLPFFADWQTGLWNHRLHPSLPKLSATQVFQPTAQAAAAAWATDIVLTTPADDLHDSRWLELAADHSIQRILHLGRRQAEPGVWAELAGSIHYASLDEIFALRQRQSSLRNIGIAQARLACEQFAENRDVPTAAVPAVSLRA